MTAVERGPSGEQSTAEGGQEAEGRADPAARAPTSPVARIAVDIPLAHLDRPFDYLVPERLADQARPGVRVRVRFAGQLTDGFLLERAERQRAPGTASATWNGWCPPSRCSPRRSPAWPAPSPTGTRAPSPTCCGSRYRSGTRPPRRQPPAGTSGRRRPGAGREPPPRPDPGSWDRYPAGPSFLDALAAGRPARAAWTALPGPAWPDEIARAAVTAASAGRGAVIVVPDARDLARVDEALAALSRRGELRPRPAPAGWHVTLTADLGPAERYRRWLAALRGEALIVAGTRAAMFAPVRDLGLVVLWDDGDDLHAEPRAPVSATPARCSRCAPTGPARPP